MPEAGAGTLAEFGLIERLASVIPVHGSGVVRSIGDDAAVLLPEAGRELVVSTDTLNQGVHFLKGVAPESLGHKSLAVNLSDLAAMGARARWALLSLSLPDAEPDWVDRFAQGFASLATRHAVALVGGDTCAGSLSVSVTILGDVPRGEALGRDGGNAGDLVCVSGTLGDAALALQRRQAQQRNSRALDLALDQPEPQLELGRRLRGLATACIDLSDGLLADLGHLTRASGLGAELQLNKLPASPEVGSLDDEQRWNLQLNGGEEYGLCFSIPKSRAGELAEAARDLDLVLTCVGRLKTGSELTCLTPAQDEWHPDTRGWDHFASIPQPSE